MTTNIQCGPLQADPSNYSKHIRLMMIKTERVPVGWRKTYADVLRDLLARDCASRSNLVLSGPSVEAGEISFSVSKDDACVAGILRKTAARLRGQCQVCGAPARMRVIGLKQRPLCAECYAPRALAAELTRLLQTWRKDLQQTPGSCIPRTICRREFARCSPTRAGNMCRANVAPTWRVA